MDTIEIQEQSSLKPAIDWMRLNAPKSVQELSDDEVIEQMGDAYRRYVTNNLLQRWNTKR